MRILITGSNGQLGNELRSILSTKVSEIGEISKEYADAEVTYVDVDKLDITDFSAVKTFLEDVRPQIIINCAAKTDVDNCETNLVSSMKINALGPRNLAICSNSLGAKLVHISTDYVFEGNGKKPYCEWDLPNPQSVYGKSKLLGERYVSQLCDKYYIIRTSWLYGYVGKNFVRTMLKLMAEKDEIKVVDDQIGNPTNANDLAYHILKIAVTDEYGVYHCTGNGECSWLDFACKIKELSGLECKVNACTSEEFKSPTKRPAFSSLDNLMLKSTVSDEMRNWEDALKTYITNIRSEEENK